MKNLVLFVLICLFHSDVFSQDTLYKRNQEVVVAKVMEIGLDEVKYKLWNYESGPTISVAKDNLMKIVFANGAVQYFAQEMADPNNYASQRKNAVKVDFLSPLRNNLSFVYERSIKPGRSIEANIGIVGVGIGTNEWEDASGAFFRVGYKFIKSPDYYLRGMRYAHLLKGGYVRPDFILGTYSQSRTVDNSYWNPVPPYNFISLVTYEKQKVTFGSIQLTIGKQWIYDDAFLVDIFGGLGYCFSDIDQTNVSSAVQYGVLGGGPDSPFSASAGFRVGFLFK